MDFIILQFSFLDPSLLFASDFCYNGEIKAQKKIWYELQEYNRKKIKELLINRYINFDECWKERYDNFFISHQKNNISIELLISL